MSTLRKAGIWQILAASAAACTTSSPAADDGTVTLPPRSRDGSEDAGAGDSGAVDAAGGITCQPLRRFTFHSTASRPLGCQAAEPATIIDEPVPASGVAFGRATFDVRLTSGSVIHFWNLRVAVGAPQASFGIGDDLCPGKTSRRSNVGLGVLGAGSDRARLEGYAGAAPCTPGAVEVMPGAVLDIWVEDERSECKGKDIAFASWYTKNSVSATHAWPTLMAPLPGIAAKLTTSSDDERLRVIGVVEGTPALNPNTACGSESATLVMQTTLDGALMATSKDVVPASQGMGHLVLFTTGDPQEIRFVKPGPHEAALLVGANFVGDVRTGGCCGDGSVALLRER
jgi:hypothetical protein